MLRSTGKSEAEKQRRHLALFELLNDLAGSMTQESESAVVMQAAVALAGPEELNLDLDTVKESVQALLHLRLAMPRGHSLRIVDAPADGSCFFYVVSKHLDVVPETLRERATKTMKERNKSGEEGVLDANGLKITSAAEEAVDMVPGATDSASALDKILLQIGTDAQLSLIRTSSEREDVTYIIFCSFGVQIVQGPGVADDARCVPLLLLGKHYVSIDNVDPELLPGLLHGKACASCPQPTRPAPPLPPTRARPCPRRS